MNEAVPSATFSNEQEPPTALQVIEGQTGSHIQNNYSLQSNHPINIFKANNDE